MDLYAVLFRGTIYCNACHLDLAAHADPELDAIDGEILASDHAMLEHAVSCEECGEELTAGWPVPELTVICEDRDDDPWSAMLTVNAPDRATLDRWLDHNGGTIGGDSWETDGDSGFAYAMPSAFVGCAASWREEGYTIDESMFTEDPLEHFAGLDAFELDCEFERIGGYLGMSADDIANVKADIAVHEECTWELWHQSGLDVEFYAWRDERVKAARKARNA